LHLMDGRRAAPDRKRMAISRPGARSRILMKREQFAERKPTELIPSQVASRRLWWQS